MLQSAIFPRFSDAEYKRRHDLVPYGLHHRPARRDQQVRRRRDRRQGEVDDDLVVIPGRREAASPESIFQGGGYGFRARAFGASRNDNNSGS